MQKVGTGVRQARIQAINVLLNLCLLGPEHGEDEGFGHGPKGEAGPGMLVAFAP